MQELIKRNTPEIADRFALEIEDRREGKSFYEIEACGDKIVLRGDCKISLAMAYYRYLKDCCGVNLAHCWQRQDRQYSQKLPCPRARQSALSSRTNAPT